MTRSKRRCTKILCEALEERRLMSLTIEVRDSGGGSSTTVTHVGQVVSLDVMAVVTDSANNPSADGVEDVSGDFLSTAVYDHAVAGNLQAANVAPYLALGSSPGAQADLNGDGNLDVGINYATAPSTEGLFFARSNPIQTGESGTGTISGNSLIFEIGTLTYTVTSLNEGGETSINFSPYVSSDHEPDAASWLENGAEKDNINGTFQAGTPYIVSDPNIVPAPTAVNYSQTVVKNTPTAINELSVDDVVAPLNDSSVTITSAASHGTTHLESNGDILYTPATGYTGPDSFVYTVADTSGKVSNPATVSINVENAPPPVAGADSVTTFTNDPVTVNVLSVDSTTSPATLVAGSVAVVTQASHGTATAQSDGTILYTPATHFTGTDTFTYTVSDSNSEISSPGTVTVTVSAPTAPTAPASTSETTSAGAPLSINILSIVTAGSLPLAPGSVTVVTAPTDGTAVAQSDGSILYTPTTGYTGNDSFTYTIADTLGNVSDTGTIAVSISHAVPPVATNVVAPALSGSPNVITVLSNVSSGSPLVASSVKIASAPSNGTALVNASTGAITYTPDPGFIGTDTFTYTAEDENLDASNAATVTVNVGTNISSAKGSPKSLTFIDAAGGAEMVSINTGSAELFFSGNGAVATTGSKTIVTGTSLELGSITLSGTTKASTLTIKGSAKTPVDVGGITDNSPLAGISAASATITGNVTLNSAASVIFGSVSNAAITLSSSPTGKFAFTAGAVIDTSLSSPVPITTLKVGSWANSDTGLSIAAPLIGTLTAAGGFDADVTLSDTGKTVDLNSAKIAGALDGSLTSGNVGTLSAGTVADTWSGTITGTLTSLAIKAGGLNSSLTATTLGTLTIGGNVTGTISASTAKSIKISGGLSGSTLTFTGAKVGTLTVGGAISGETITAANGFTSITAGSISQSTITAGGTAGNTFANATAANLGGSTIGSIKVTSKAAGAFDDSSILAGSIASVSLGNINTDDSSENNGTDVPFGIATRSLGSFSATFAAGPAHLGKSLLLNEEVLNAYLVQKGIVFGDFGIELES